MTEHLISFHCLTCVEFLLNIPAVSYSNMTANVNENVKHISSTTIDTAVLRYSLRQPTRRKQNYFRGE